VHVSGCCCFSESDINISQGSVARDGEIFYYRFTTNLLLSFSVKNFENRSVFGKVRGKNIVAPFFQRRCI